jgi:predicted AAA+ superfamily ATPase
MYFRKIEQRIEEWLFEGKIIILYGARQVGKTTLAKKICSLQEKKGQKTSYFNCEDPVVANSLIGKSAEQIHYFLEVPDLVVLDEAQSIKNIGRILKIYHDHYPKVQIIATGSSSFDLANQINEPLTGRSIEFKIYPLSIREISSQQNPLSLKSKLAKFLLYGLYPDIVDRSNQISRELVLNLTKKYLYKDILNFEGIKNSNLVYKVLKALAYQLGSEVNYTKLANLVQSNKNTVERYIDILEKSFIIFRLPAFGTNQRKEISKTKKIYFWDVGLRNALIEDFGDLDLRQDIGGIWENFCILEFLKNYQNEGKFGQFYFWRTYTQQEVDLIIKQNSLLKCFEFKWSSKKTPKIPKSFAHSYPQHTFEVVNQNNWLEVIG